MREVRLTRGMVALVDDEDFERVSQHRWYPFRPRNTWYGQMNVKLPDGKRRTLSLHRFILSLPPGRVPQVDHIDGVGLNCQRENMRLATHGQNMQNRQRAHSNSKTGVRGVTLDKRCGSYRAAVVVNRRNISLGSYPTLAAAEQAAIAGRKRYMTHAPECTEQAERSA